MDMDAATLYAKLFKALEEGKKKEETAIVSFLRSKYGIPRGHATAKWLATNVAPEQVFHDIVTQLAPFSQMLNEIYTYLGQHRTTVTGRSDQLGLKIADLGPLPFDLNSFPKTYVDVLRKSVLYQEEFDPYATGWLLVDQPDYWGEYNALLNLGGHPLLIDGLLDLIPQAAGHPNGEALIARYRPQLEAAVDDARRILEACEAFLDHSVKRDWNRVQHLYFERRSSTLATNPDGWNLTRLHEMIEAWTMFLHYEATGTRSSQDPRIPEAGLFERYLQAFSTAVRLVLRPRAEVVTFLDRLVDRVIIPFWRHRWRLYEVWALILTLREIPSGLNVRLITTPRDDDTGDHDWELPHGMASTPVAEATGRGADLQVWFQRKTPYVSGMGNIEPDIRIRTPSPSDHDVFIFELKDRWNGSQTHAKRVAANYAAGSSARYVCITNYCRFQGNAPAGSVTMTSIGTSTVLIASEVKPGQVYPEIMAAIKDAVDQEVIAGSYNLLVDISGSTDPYDIRAEVAAVLARFGPPGQIYTFTGYRLEISDSSLSGVVSGGSTELSWVLDEYFRNGYGSTALTLRILTDEDGEAMFLDWNRPAGWNGRVELLLY